MFTIRSACFPLVLFGTLSAQAVPERPNQPSQIFAFDSAPARASSMQVASAGDVDRDGFDDVLVGLPLESPRGGGAQWTGRASLYSGRDGAILFEFHGERLDQLGWRVAGLGDTDRDGHPDFAIASIAEVRGLAQGVVRVHSGKDGSLLHTLVGAPNEVRVGWALCGIGDIDGDGCRDVAYSAIGQDAQSPGRVYIASGRTGLNLRRIDGRNGERLGAALANAGDMNRDGVDDLLVSSFNRAALQLRSGRDGSLIFEMSSAVPTFASSFASIADVDADGSRDILVGSTWFALPGHGSVAIHSGKNGRILREKTTSEAFDDFGAAIMAMPDADADGLPDILVGAPRADVGALDVGKAYLLSSRNFTVLREFTGGRPHARFGAALARAGDVNGDGTADVLIAAPTNGSNYRDGRGVYRAARIEVLSSGELSLSSDTHLVAPAGLQTLHLRAGRRNAKKFYLLLGSMTGTDTTSLPWFDIRLSFDLYSQILLSSPGLLIDSTVGQLDPDGNASMRLQHLPILDRPLFHAYVVFDPVTFTICCPSVPVPATMLRR